MADAGADQSVNAYAVVELNGTDVTWTQTGGTPTVTLGASGANRTFIAPAVRAGTTLTFTATDPATATDTMSVAVFPQNEWAVIGGVEVPINTVTAHVDAGADAMPTAAPDGFTRVFEEDFNDGIGYPEGSFVVGAGGTADDGRLLVGAAPYARYYSKLNLYPDDNGYPNAPVTAKYWTSKVVSTQKAATEPTANGLLNIRCHTETISGTPTAVSGWVRPIVPGEVSQKIGYCHIAARIRVKNVSNTSNWGGVMLLIPDNWPDDGEIDFPEAAFNEKVGGFFHYKQVGGDQLPFYVVPDAFWDSWHVYETFWQPGRLIHKMDGVTVLDTTDRVPTANQKFVLQCGVHSNAMPTSSAVAEWQIDWIVVDDFN